MPRVPTYDQPQVALNPLPGVRQSSDAPAGAFSNGGEVMSAAGKMLGAYAEKRIEQDSDAAAWNAYTQFSDTQRQLLYDPNSGLYAKKGGDAAGAAAAGAKAMGDAAKEISGGLSDAARLKFEHLYRRSMDSTLDGLARHEADQTQVWRDQAAKGVLETSQKNAAVKWNDPAYIDQSAELAAMALRQNLAGKGTAPELIESQVSSMRSGVWKAAIYGAIQSDPIKAKELLDSHRDKLAGDDSVELDKAIKSPFLVAKGQQIAASVGTQKTSLPSNIASGIAQAAQAQGVDVATALTIAQLENAGGDPNLKNPNSSAHGIFQFTNGTWQATGGTAADRGDVNKQIDLGVKHIKENSEQLRDVLGRQPTGAEIYLAHQQGIGGAKALLSAQSGETALTVLTRAYKGDVKTAGAALVNNGGDFQMTAQQFVGLWQRKYASRAAGTSPMSLSDRIMAAKAYAGDDVELQKHAVAEVTSQYAIEERARKEAQDSALEQVYNSVLQTGSFANAPKEALSKLDSKTLLELQDKARDVKTNWQFYDSYMAKTPQEKAAVPMQDLMANLGPTEIRTAIKERNEGKGGSSKQPWLQSRASIMQSFARESGIIPSGNKLSTSQQQKYNQFSEYMNRQMDMYRSEKGGEMSEADFRREAAKAVTKVVTPDTSWYSSNPRVFELNGQKIKSISSTSDIPASMKSEIESGIRSAGKKPSDALTLALAKAWITGDRAGAKLLLDKAE